MQRCSRFTNSPSVTAARAVAHLEHQGSALHPGCEHHVRGYHFFADVHETRESEGWLRFDGLQSNGVGQPIEPTAGAPDHPQAALVSHAIGVCARGMMARGVAHGMVYVMAEQRACV